MKTIKFCKKCNSETDRYADGRCKPCRDAYMSAYNAKYYTDNMDKLRESMKKRYEDNRDKEIEYRREWYAANRVRELERKVMYRAANIDKERARSLAWQKDNPERVKIIQQNRRARKCAAGGKLSTNLSERLFKLQKGKCACCGLPLGDKYHLDHIMPLALGGLNTDDNIQLLRAECNLQKNAKHPIDFMQQRGFLL